MKRLKRAIKVVIAVLGTLILLIALVFLFWLGPTLKLVVQKIGPKVLGTNVQIENLSINPRKGIVQLSGFTIANPDTFGESNAVSLASLNISIDMTSLFSQTVVVHQVEFNSPHFIYEQSSASDNISEFILNIHQFANIDPSAPPQNEAKTKKKKPKKESKKVIVESLEINDVQFHMVHTENRELDFGVGFKKLSVSMTRGLTRLDDFYISNPSRLVTPNLFMLDEVEIKVKPSSIHSTNIVIDAVQIDSPRFYIEQNAETDSIAEYLKIVNTLIDKIPSKPPPTNIVAVAEIEPVEPAPPPPKITLNSLIMDGLQFDVLNVASPELDVYVRMDQLAILPDQGAINLTNIHLTNPTRLKTKNLLSLESLSVQFRPESLKADTLIIENIELKKPHACLELNKEANTVGEFLKIANSYIDRIPMYEIPKATQSPKKQEKKKDPPPPLPVALHNLQIDDIQIKLLDTTPTNNIPDEARMLAGISTISIGLSKGKLEIKEISIPNVEGFADSNMFEIVSIDISAEPDSIFSDQMVIHKIFINSPNTNLEQTKESGNVAELQTTLMQFIPHPEALPTRSTSTNQIAETPTGSTNDPELPAEPRMVLHELLLTDLSVNLRLPVVTNAPVTSLMGHVDLSKLNPVDRLKRTAPPEDADPNPPITLVGFKQLSMTPLDGLLSITNLHISNPPGFSNRNLIKLDEFKVKLDPTTLHADTLVVEEIILTKPRIRYERQIMSDNIKALQQEIRKAVVRRQENLDPTPPETITGTNAVAQADAPASEEQKVIVKHLLLSNVIVRAKLSALPAIPTPPFKIERYGIGQTESGASFAEAGSILFETIYEGILGAVSSTTGLAGDTLKGAGTLTTDTIGNVFYGVGNLIGGTTKVITNTVEEVKKPRSNKRGAGGRRKSLR